LQLEPRPGGRGYGRRRSSRSDRDRTGSCRRRADILLQHRLVVLLQVVPHLQRGMAERDGERVLVGVLVRRLDLQEQAVRLDAALVVRLVIQRLRQRAHDLAGKLFTTRAHEKAVHVVGRILFVLHEYSHQVAERFGLELIELVRAAQRSTRAVLGAGLEHDQKAPRGFIGLP